LWVTVGRAGWVVILWLGRLGGQDAHVKHFLLLVYIITTNGIISAVPESPPPIDSNHHCIEETGTG